MLHTKTPDETGWYWVKERGSAAWFMAHLDTCDEEVRMHIAGFVDGASVRATKVYCVTGDFALFDWHGPIHCPGGDLGSETVLLSEETHSLAAERGAAIVLRHVDYSHCTPPRGTATTVDVRPFDCTNKDPKCKP